jgi:quinol monooxygenase YgiN
MRANTRATRWLTTGHKVGSSAELRKAERRYVSSRNRNWRLKMSTVAGVIAFKAKQGEGSEVARLIAAALPHVERESGTPLWVVLQSNADPDTIFLVDLFRDAADRDIHMSGEAAKQIFATVPQLLSEEPRIHPADLIAHKGV